MCLAAISEDITRRAILPLFMKRVDGVARGGKARSQSCSNTSITRTPRSPDALHHVIVFLDKQPHAHRPIQHDASNSNTHERRAFCGFDFVMYNTRKRKARCHCTIVPRESAYTNATVIPSLASNRQNRLGIKIRNRQVVHVYCSSIGASSS